MYAVVMLGRARAGALCTVGLMLIACAKQTVVPVASPSADKVAGDALDPLCRSPRRDGKSLLVDWPAPERARLETLLQKGTVALHFDGCRAELLPDCGATGVYTYVPLTASRNEVTMLDADELESELPFRSRTLADDIKRYGEVRFEFVLAGRWQAPVPNAIRLRGACERATHIVTAIDVGAFSLMAGPSEELTEAVDRRVLEHAGDSTKCGSDADHGQPPNGCATLLRLQLDSVQSVVHSEGCPPRTRWNGTLCLPKEPSDWCAPRSFWNGRECESDADSESAQSDYLRVDEQIRNSELGAGAVYAGTPVEVIERYRQEAKLALELHRALQQVINAHSSPEWKAIATLRQALVYFTLYRRLDASRAPNIHLFTDDQEAMLSAADESGNDELLRKAASIRAKVARAWRDAKQTELAGAAEVMIDRFATALLLSGDKRAAHVVSAVATIVLADVTAQLGEGTLANGVNRVSGLSYSPGMFVRMLAVMQEQARPLAEMKVPCPDGLAWLGVACAPADPTRAIGK